jgi:uncharacterized protein
MPFSPKPKQTSWPRPHGLSRIHRISFAGLEMLPHLSGALYVPTLKTLLIADLHLEQGAAMARRGVHLPPYDTVETLEALEQVIAECAPEKLYLLGDSFHDAAGHLLIDEREATRLTRITQEVPTIWISGNHDPDPKTGLGGEHVDEIRLLDGITLRHEPRRNLKNAFEISGHLHPGCAIEQRGIHVRGKCFASDGQRLILPAFGRYTGALNIKSGAYDGLFNPAETQVWMLGETRIHNFPYKRLS